MSPFSRYWLTFLAGAAVIMPGMLLIATGDFRPEIQFIAMAAFVPAGFVLLGLAAWAGRCPKCRMGYWASTRIFVGTPRNCPKCGRDRGEPY